MNDRLPIIGLTMGCPCGVGPEIVVPVMMVDHRLEFPVLAAEGFGVGPEIIVKALHNPGLYTCCRPVVFGVPAAIQRELRARDDDTRLHLINDPDEATVDAGSINLIPVADLPEAAMAYGQPTAETGRVMARCIEAAADLAIGRRIAALATAPITKKSLQQAGYRFPGHTELLAHLTNTRRVVMMLAGTRLRVALATIHCALRAACDSLTTAQIRETIAITHHHLHRDFGLHAPRIAVAGLNPHAGEDGLFGAEEQRIIEPAVAAAAADGLSVSGPYPPDTLFYRAAQQQFDAVICMYHDQGLIPLKLLHFDDAVNITLGLPIIRTSVDHGTAYDIAGQNRANAASMTAAVQLAVTMAHNRARTPQPGPS